MKTGYHVVDATGFDLSSPGKVDGGIYIDTPNGSFTCSTADVISANA